jgi:hypothetical protein
MVCTPEGKAVAASPSTSGRAHAAGVEHQHFGAPPAAAGDRPDRDVDVPQRRRAFGEDLAG